MNILSTVCGANDDYRPLLHKISRMQMREPGCFTVAEAQSVQAQFAALRHLIFEHLYFVEACRDCSG